MRAFLRPGVVLLVVGVVGLLGLTVAGASVGVGSGRGLAEETGGAAKPPAGESPILKGPTVVVVSELPRVALEAAGRGKAITIPRKGMVSGVRQEGAGQPPNVNVFDSRGADIGEVAGAPALSLSQFDGLDDDDNFFATGFTVSPADPQVAVGPNYVFEMVNNVGRIFDKSGTILRTFALKGFFLVPDDHEYTDPKIIYDALSGRWFAAYISSYDDPLLQDDGRLHIAVSQTSDPTGAWNRYFLIYDDVFPDYPGIGVTDDKFTVSANVFDIDSDTGGSVADGCSPSTGFCGEQTVVIQKSDLIAGVPAEEIGLTPFSLDLDRLTVRPAHSLSAGSDQYLTTFSTTRLDSMTVIRITGTPDEGNVVRAAVTDLTIISQDDPPPSITAGTGSCLVFTDDLGPPPCIDSGDYRMLESVWRDDSLWSAASAACVPPGDSEVRSCAHLIEVGTVGTPSVRQDIMFGASGEYYSWPAIRTDASGALYVSLTHTNSSIFAEARITGRLAADPLNTMSGSTLLHTGEVVHTSGRWGDYLGAAVDPADQNCIWLVGQYAKETAMGANWGTYIGAASYSGGCSGGALATTPTPSATPTPTTTASPPGTTTPTGDASSTATATPTTTVGATNTPTPTLTPTWTPAAPPTATPTSTLLPTGTPTSTPVSVIGDTNCDGSVDPTDATLILQLAAALISSLPCPGGGDANGDGITNIVDATLILQFSAGLISRLPP